MNVRSRRGDNLQIECRDKGGQLRIGQRAVGVIEG